MVDDICVNYRHCRCLKSPAFVVKRYVQPDELISETVQFLGLNPPSLPPPLSRPLSVPRSLHRSQIVTNHATKRSVAASSKKSTATSTVSESNTRTTTSTVSVSNARTTTSTVSESNAAIVRVRREEETKHSNNLMKSNIIELGSRMRRECQTPDPPNALADVKQAQIDEAYCRWLRESRYRGWSCKREKEFLEYNGEREKRRREIKAILNPLAYKIWCEKKQEARQKGKEVNVKKDEEEQRRLMELHSQKHESLGYRHSYRDWLENGARRLDDDIKTNITSISNPSAYLQDIRLKMILDGLTYTDWMNLKTIESQVTSSCEFAKKPK